MRIARVFPSITKATPHDDLTFFGPPPRLFPLEIEEVHISVAFTWDKQRAEDLAYQWEVIGVPVKIGGPAYNQPGGEFIPGMYLKKGYTITSRGCPNRCWFCAVPKREGYQLSELPVKDGWNILDDNLLACSEKHIHEVFDMLSQQPHQPEFTGGLEAKIIKPWHCELLKKVKTHRMYFAYDTPDDLEPLICAGKMLKEAGFTFESHVLCCYCLIGYKGDTFEKAKTRLCQTIKAGFMPYAMLYRDETGQTDPEWKKFQREWLRPQIVATKMKEEREDGRT